MTGISAEAEGTVQRLCEGMAGGVLSFPLTSFHSDGGLDLDSYRTYLTGQLAAAQAPGAVFPACGTGEFFSLDEDEYREVVRVTVEVAAGRLPVVAGIGYGWAQARRFARIAEEAGAAFTSRVMRASSCAPRLTKNTASSSVPLSGCGTPQAATSPDRTPATATAASSTSWQ